MSLIIGIDPDSKAHGVAIYENKILVELCNLQLMDIQHRFLIPKIDCHFVVENVVSNKPIFNSGRLNKNTQGRKGQNVGQCKQSQIELVRVLDYHNAAYELMRPMAGNWGTSKNKGETKLRTEIFKKATGWTKKSNSDTRSAAFFGFLATRRAEQT